MVLLPARAAAVGVGLREVIFLMLLILVLVVLEIMLRVVEPIHDMLRGGGLGRDLLVLNIIVLFVIIIDTFWVVCILLFLVIFI